MKIILNNELELSPISAMGGKRFVQGENRDTISFTFPVDTSMDEIDAIFTEGNCESITIVEGENEYIHNGYVIRAELKREPIEVTPATESEAAVYENRVIVSMSQRTYAETQMAAMKAAIDLLYMEDVEV